MSPAVDSGPNLLMDWHESRDSRNWLRAGIGSIAIHIFLVLAAIFFAGLDTPMPRRGTEIVSSIQRVTPLIAPPKRLTQQAPNRGKVSKEVDVESLLARQTRPQPPAPPLTRAFKPPSPPKQALFEPTPPRLVEPPKIDTATNSPQPQLPSAGVPQAPPPPQIQPEEKPKLAFETPGQHGTTSSPTMAKLEQPKTTVEDAIRGVARGGQGGPVVGDIEQPPNLPDTLRLPPMPQGSRSQLELLSDPMNVDFKPYLIRILSLVRRNWFAVIPESARLGNRGVVLIQFVVDRNGQVPKLVIATPSGSEALDRAAVAGVSASVPFPPLPADFKGRAFRLQFPFKYKVT